MSYFGSIYKDNELTSRASNVYRYLADRANSDGQCWPSERTIAQDLKISKQKTKTVCAFTIKWCRQLPNMRIVKTKLQPQTSSRMILSIFGWKNHQNVGWHHLRSTQSLPDGITNAQESVTNRNSSKLEVWWIKRDFKLNFQKIN